MTETLVGVNPPSPKDPADPPSAEELAAAKELVRQARAQGDPPPHRRRRHLPGSNLTESGWSVPSSLSRTTSGPSNAGYIGPRNLDQEPAPRPHSHADRYR